MLWRGGVFINIEVSPWGKIQKYITISAGIIYILEFIISIVFKISILGGGIGCISLSVFLLGLGIKQLNLYKNTNEISDLIIGVILVATFAIFLSMGILQLQGYIGYIMNV